MTGGVGDGKIGKIGGDGLQTSVRIQLVKYTDDAPVETSSEAQCAGVSHGMSRAVRSQRKAQCSHGFLRRESQLG